MSAKHSGVKMVQMYAIKKTNQQIAFQIFGGIFTEHARTQHQNKFYIAVCFGCHDRK
jgi:hypothetical protein